MSRHRPSSRWLGAAVVSGAAIAVLYAGIHYGTFAAADSDPYGYVSEADAMANGALRLDQRFARAMTWPDAPLTFCPPGWRPAADGFIVPIYSPGLPLAMAAVQRVGGRAAIYYVVPFLGALMVWLAGILGARIHDPLTGATAAVLVASSPVFLYQLVQPVSDVPAACWWTMTLTLAVGGGLGASLVSGLAASMAILTRPNLVLLTAVPAAFLLLSAIAVHGDERSRAIRRLIAFVSGTIPGCLVVAAFNQHLYGSPFQSGYWQQEDLFAWSHLGPNLDRYPRWLLQTQTPFIFLALLAPWAARRRAAAADAAPRTGHVWLLFAFAVSVFLSYLFYAPFGRDEWGYLRFLLPAFPALLILSVVVCRGALARAGRSQAASVAIVLAVCGALAIWQVRTAIRSGALSLWAAERRYVDVGAYIAEAMPHDAIFVAGAQSGSIRYYSNRLTVRYDLLEPHRLDDVVATLGAKGYHPYLALEEGEESTFRERFASFSELARLDWPPAVQRSEDVRVRIYDPADRARFLAGEAIGTGDVDLRKKPILTRRKP